MSEQTTAGGTIVGVQDAQGSAGAPGDVLERDQPCVKCGYMLRGLPVGGVCPECGTGVAESLKGILLQFAGEPYRKTVQSGLALVLNGILAMILLAMAGFGLAVARVGGELLLVLGGANLLVSIAILLGYWRYTEPDPGYTGLEKPTSARAVTRWAAVAGAVIGLLSAGLTAVTWLAPNMPGFAIIVVVQGALSIGSLVAMAVQFFAVMQYTRWMGSRVPDAHIQKRAKLYLWLLPLIAIVGALILMLGPLVALIMYWNLLNRVHKHVKAINTAGVPATLPGMLG